MVDGVIGRNSTNGTSRYIEVAAKPHATCEKVFETLSHGATFHRLWNVPEHGTAYTVEQKCLRVCFRETSIIWRRLQDRK